MSFEEFCEEVGIYSENNPKWRLGQTIFNVLYFKRPDISERIRATKLDPFHMKDDQISRFLSWLEKNW